MLNKKQTTEQANRMLAEGISHADVYNQLLPQVQSEKILAHAIASYVDPALMQKHKGKRVCLAALFIVTNMLGTLGLFITEGATDTFRFAAIFALILTLTIATLTYRMNRWGYFLLFLMVVTSGSRMIEAIKADPIAGIIGSSINIGVFLYAAYVQHKVVPYMMMFFQPDRGRKAKYAFLEQPDSAPLN